MKRSYLILGIIGIIILGAGAAYFLRGGVSLPLPGTRPPSTGTLPPVAPPTPPGTDGGSGTPPPTGTNGSSFGIISRDHDVLDYYVDTQNTVILIRPDGKVFEVVNGNATTLSDTPLDSLASASFSRDGGYIFTLSRNGTKTSASVFQVREKLWKSLPAGTEAGAWSPTSSTLALLIKQGDGGKSSLVTYDAASQTQSRSMLDLYQEDLLLQWPTPREALFIQKGSAFFSGSVWRFDLVTKTLVPLLERQLGLEAAYDGGDNVGVAFIANKGGRGGKLVTFSERANPALLSFLTLPSKCAFSTPQDPLPAAPSGTEPQASVASYNALLYCGIPRNADGINLQPLPDNYNKHTLFTADDIYRIDLRNGAVTLVLAEKTYNFDLQKLKHFGDKLFFINRLDQKLYAVVLAS